MSVDFVVGDVGFGPNLNGHTEEVAQLEARVAELIRHRNRLREVLMRCAALSPDVSDAKHEVLLATDPKND